MLRRNAEPQAAEVLRLARAFHAPASERPRWATFAHACATSTAQGDHLAVPLEAITSHAQLGDTPPEPAYLRPLGLPDPGGAMEVLLSPMQHPRTQERVPAGTEFTLDISVRLFNDDDEQAILGLIREGLTLVEDDAFGASGSRGSGRVRFDYTVT